MKELKIGEEIRIKCVEGRDCTKCLFNTIVGRCSVFAKCLDVQRTDHKDVCFEIVEDECPSDETIMRVLNCIGYEEQSWIDIVRKNWMK